MTMTRAQEAVRAQEQEVVRRRIARRITMTMAVMQNGKMQTVYVKILSWNYWNSAQAEGNGGV
jgi:hypothetical protein